jgi:hypothetical protein
MALSQLPTTPRPSDKSSMGKHRYDPTGFFFASLRLRESRKGRPPAETPGPSPAKETEEKEKRQILCRHCRQGITQPEERISVQGAHRHTFANPHGIVFEIGCFKTVRNCAAGGPASGEFTWFSGYRWRILICGACLTHLGWMFASSGFETFYGLILDRLVFPD